MLADLGGSLPGSVPASWTDSRVIWPLWCALLRTRRSRADADLVSPYCPDQKLVAAETGVLEETSCRRAGPTSSAPGTSNGPIEAINGRVEHLRGSALGFRNLSNYIARSLLETGGFRPRLHPGS